MKHAVDAATDIAGVMLFDPEAMPDDFDSRGKGDEAYEVLEELHSTGKVVLVSTGSDGGFLLHAYLDEPIPENLRQYAKDPVELDKFPVPSGKLYFTGSEYAFRRDDSDLRFSSHMGGSFELAPGSYRLELFQTSYPEGMFHEILRQEAGPFAAWLHDAIGCRAILTSVVAFFLLAMSLAFVRPVGVWAKFVLPPLGALVIWPFVASVLPPYRKAVKRLLEIEKRYPSVVAHLERTGTR